MFIFDDKLCLKVLITGKIYLTNQLVNHLRKYIIGEFVHFKIKHILQKLLIWRSLFINCRIQAVLLLILI